VISANLVSYGVQSAIVVIVGLAAPRVLGLRAPGAALRDVSAPCWNRMRWI